MAQCEQFDFCSSTADGACAVAAPGDGETAAAAATAEVGLRSFHAAAASYNVVYACTACVLNALLVSTVLLTPSLHSPPNAFLVSLCANNVLLAVSAAFPVASAFGAAALTPGSLRLLDFLQVATMYACNANYWLTFAAVGRYRFAHARRPAADAGASTPASRWRAVRASIGLVWALSAGASLVYAAALVVDGCLEAEARWDGAVTFYLRGGVAAAEAAAAAPRSRAVVMYAVVVLLSTGLIGACLLVVLKTYVQLLKAHGMLPRTARHNRVAPARRRRHLAAAAAAASAISPADPRFSVGAFAIGSMGLVSARTPPVIGRTGDGDSRSAAAIAPAAVCADSVRGASQRRSFEGHPRGYKYACTAAAAVAAFGAVGGAATSASLVSPAAEQTAASTERAIEPRFGVDRRPTGSFHDLSMLDRLPPRAAEVESGGTGYVTGGDDDDDFGGFGAAGTRRRRRRRPCASCLTATTKNSLVIIVGYAVCSAPFLVSSVPGSLAALNCSDRLLVAYVAEVIFYFSPVIQPLWYLFFTRHVRRTLSRANRCWTAAKLRWAQSAG